MNSRTILGNQAFFSKEAFALSRFLMLLGQAGDASDNIASREFSEFDNQIALSQINFNKCRLGRVLPLVYYT